MKFLIVLALLLAGPAMAATDEPETRFARADLLFPEAAGWTRVDGLAPATGLAGNAALIDRLAAAAFPDEPPDNDGDTCSSRFRMRTDPRVVAAIRQGDLFGTGKRDLIYADLMICAEGSLTVVWRDVDGPARPKAMAFWGRALRVEKAANPRMTMVREGCCASLDDFYLIRRLGQPQPVNDVFYQGALRIVHASVLLDLPPGAKAQTARITLKGRTTLLPDPTDTQAIVPADDDPDDIPSPGIYADYAAGTRLDQVATHVDDKGRNWALVVGPLVEPDGDEPRLNLGWIPRP